MMGALETGQPPDTPDNSTPAARLTAAAQRMSAALVELADAVRGVEPALATVGAQALRAIVYSAVSELVNSEAHDTLIDIIVDFQNAEIDEAALRIATLTGRRAQDIADAIEHWLQRSQDGHTFIDCMTALSMEIYAVRWVDSPASYRFPFDMEPAEEPEE